MSLIASKPMNLTQFADLIQRHQADIVAYTNHWTQGEDAEGPLMDKMGLPETPPYRQAIRNIFVALASDLFRLQDLPTAQREAILKARIEAQIEDRPIPC